MLKILVSLGYAGDFNKLRKLRCNPFYGFLFAPLYKIFLIRHSSYIPLTSKIKGPIKFHHLNGIFITCFSEIGVGCTIFQQVTIDSNYTKGSKTYGVPKIGDNVFIGSGAKIIGGITIGNNVRIGAGCVVVENIPDNAVVVMSKPRIIIK